MGIFETLNRFLLGRNTWPPPGQREVWEQIDRWRALRRSDEARLRVEANWHWRRPYLITPIPRMISRAKSNLLYGEPSEYAAPNDRDQGNLEYVISQNGLDAELHRAAMIASSEREVWGRIIMAPDLLDVPIIEYVSRRQVIPHFRGRFVVGATFIQEWAPGGYGTVYRLLETYEAGAVHARLWKGTRSNLGTDVPLDSFEPTQGKPETVLTGIPYPLAVFIPNSIDSDPTAGFSDYQGLEQRFLSVNETATIGQENVRLAGKKRALVDSKYLRNGRLPAGDDIFVRSSETVTAGEGGKPLQLLEYDPGTDKLRDWLDATIDTTLNLGGTAPELVGRNISGGNISGTALKLRMIHSLMEGAGTGGFFDRANRRLLRAAGILDARPTTMGGFGRRWVEPDVDPTIIRGDGLPRDDMEAAQWLVLATGAEAISLPERVRWLHPDWSQDQVDDEVAKIEAERNATAPVRDLPVQGGNRPGGPPELDEGGGLPALGQAAAAAAQRAAAGAGGT